MGMIGAGKNIGGMGAVPGAEALKKPKLANAVKAKMAANAAAEKKATKTAPETDKSNISNGKEASSVKNVSFVDSEIMARDTTGPTPEELKWAVNLEKKVVQGYSPTEAEQERYTDIYDRYQNSDAEKSEPGLLGGLKHAAAEVGEFIGEIADDIVETFNSITDRIGRFFSGKEAPETVSQKELDWALGLEHKVKASGYQPTAEDIEKYTDIANRLQAQFKAAE